MLLNRFINFLHAEKKFIIMLSLLNVQTVFSWIFQKPITLENFRHDLSGLMYVIAFSVTIAAIFFILGKKFPLITKFLKNLTLIFCAIIFLADLFTLTYYGVPVNRTLLEIILATNFNEASEFFSVYVLEAKFLKILAVIAIIFLVLWKIKFPRINEKILAVLLIVFVTCTFARALKVPESVLGKANSIVRVSLILPYVYKSIQDYQGLLASVSGEIKLTRNESDLPLIIFILGESTTRNHLQLYGYNLPTTPLLAERNLRGELKIFSDTVSPHAHTIPCLQKIFTFLRTEDSPKDFYSGNFFEILNAAGYHTVWLSNQEAGGIWGNLGKIYSKSCSEKNFTRLRDSYEESLSAFDEELLPMLAESLEHPHEKSFYVLHLMGTHLQYNRRYPKTYEKFSAEDETHPEKKAREIRATYDNAVLYNDYIINQVIEQVKNFDAVVIYISDHGDDVYDEKDFAGHEETNPSRIMFEVPFVIWTSEKFQANHPALEQKFSAALNKPFMSDDMIHFLMDMLKIETPNFDETLSPLSEKYNSERQRKLGGKIYDKESGLH